MTRLLAYEVRVPFYFVVIMTLLWLAVSYLGGKNTIWLLRYQVRDQQLQEMALQKAHRQPQPVRYSVQPPL